MSCLVGRLNGREAFPRASNVEFMEGPYNGRYCAVMSFRPVLRFVLPAAAILLAGCVCLYVFHGERDLPPTRIDCRPRAQQEADLAKARIRFFELDDDRKRLWIRHHDSATGLPTLEAGTVDLCGRGKHSVLFVNHDQAANQLILTIGTPGLSMPVYARVRPVEGGFLATWSPLAGSRGVRRERRVLQTLLPGYVGAQGQFRFHKSASLPASRVCDGLPVKTRKTRTRTYRQAVEYAESLKASIQPIPRYVEKGMLQGWFERLGKIIPWLAPKPRPLPGWRYSYGDFGYEEETYMHRILSAGTVCLDNHEDASLILIDQGWSSGDRWATFTVLSPGKKQAVSLFAQQEDKEYYFSCAEERWSVSPPGLLWGKQIPPALGGEVDPFTVYLDSAYPLELEFLNGLKYAYDFMFDGDVSAEPNNPEFARYYWRDPVPGEKLVIRRYPRKGGKWPAPALGFEGSEVRFETERCIFISRNGDLAAYDKQTDEYFYVFVSQGFYIGMQDVALVDDWLLIGQRGLSGLWAIHTSDFSVRQFPAATYACDIEARPTAIVLNKTEGGEQMLPRPLTYGGFVRRASEVGKPYPQSCRYDSIRSAQGGTICIDGLKGRVVLLDLWSLQDRTYRAEIPDLVRLYSDYHAQGLEMIGICCTASCRSDQAARLIEELGILWQQYADEPILWPTDDGRSPKRGNCPEGGTTRLLLDRQGVVRYKDLSGPPLTDAVQTLLGESPATPTK